MVMMVLEKEKVPVRPREKGKAMGKEKEREEEREREVERERDKGKGGGGSSKDKGKPPIKRPASSLKTPTPKLKPKPALKRPAAANPMSNLTAKFEFNDHDMDDDGFGYSVESSTLFVFEVHGSCFCQTRPVSNKNHCCSCNYLKVKVREKKRNLERRMRWWKMVRMKRVMVKNREIV